MKKLFISLIAVLFSVSIIGQVATTPVKVTAVPVTKTKDSMTMVVKTTQPEKIAETILVQDSVNKEQAKTIDAKDSTITATKNELQKIKDSASHYLLNDLPVEYFFWGMFFVLLGVIASWALKSLFGMSSKENTTSTKWDWSEFFKPYNVKRRVASFAASFILAFFTIRFADAWFGAQGSMAYCAGVGLTLDLIIAWYWSKRKSFAPKNVQNDTPPNQ